MSNAELMVRPNGAMVESVLLNGDLRDLSPEMRLEYYKSVCESVGLNPLTKPFEYIVLNGKLTLYARKDATDQLRSLHGISVTDMTESEREGVFTVTVKVQNRDGRTDMAKGAVNIANLKGEALANALMKAETKAKRRATLSICGLGLLDETEIETIPAAAIATVEEAPTPKLNASQAKKQNLWPQFIEKCRAFTDLDALEAWWADARTQTYVNSLPNEWQVQAAEEYEKRQEALYEVIAKQ